MKHSPTLGLFIHNNQVWWSGPNFPNHHPEDEQPFTDFPVVTAVEGVDFHEGDGWGRAQLSQHATVLEAYRYDVGSGHENHVVVAEFKTAEDLLAVVDEFPLLEKLHDRL